MLYDISRTITPTTAVWPGDHIYTVQPQLSLAEDASVNLTTLIMSPHTGSHADAYFHYSENGAHPSTMPLDAYIGKAQVVSTHKHSGALTPQDFAHVDLRHAERLLIHSPVSDLPDNQFANEFPYLSLELIEWLSLQHVCLIGLDSPSVDAFESKDLPCHHALKWYGIVNLECLCLRSVPDGEYELIALPLKLDLACASPVRAILRTL